MTTVTVAQALASSASGLLVLDTAGAIVGALPNSALTARVASFTVSAPALLTAAQMTLLFPITSKLHAAVGALQLTGANTFSIAQLTPFEALPGFAVAVTGSINLTDMTAQIVALLSSHPAWFAQIATFTIRLDGSVLGAYPASQLNGLITHGKTLTFVPTTGHTALNIAAAAHDLATNTPALNSLGTHVALSIAVTNDGSAISAADAASLLTLQSFNVAAHTLTVSDIGANLSPRIAGLLGHGYGQIMVTSGTLSATASQLLDTTVHYAIGSHAQLSTSTTTLVVTATSLASLPGFSSAPAVVLTVSDSEANLTANSSAWLGVAGAASLTADATVTSASLLRLYQISNTLTTNFSLAGHSVTVSDTLTALTSLPSGAAALTSAQLLNANATVGATQLAMFANLAHPGLAGHTITLIDTATNILALPSGTLNLISAATLSADSSVGAINLAILAGLPNFSTGGHALAVTDTAANLLAIAPGNLSQATSTVLSADATVNAQQALTLWSDPGFSTGGHQLAIADMAANLLSLPHGLQLASSILELAGSQTVGATTLAQLAALGIKFSEAGHTLTCMDTATNLAALTSAGLALVTSEVLGTSATVTASTASSLAALPNFSLANGVTLSVQDSVNNLISLGQGAPAVTTSETLPFGTMVTIGAVQAATLAALPHFSAAGATITVSDTIARLNAAGAPTLAFLGNIVDVVDTAANLAASAGTMLVQGATLVSLAGNAQLMAAAAAQIASIPNFNPGPYQLTVSDTAMNIAQYGPAVLQVAGAAIVTNGGPVNIAAADRLATIAAAGILSFQGGNQLLVQDSFAALTDASNSAGFALAARVGVLDTATNLILASAHNWSGLNPTYTLSQGGTISAANATALAALGSHFFENGYSLVVADSASAVVAAASALTALNVMADVTDTASNLRTRAGSLLGLGSSVAQITVSDVTPVTASVAAGLSTLASLLTGPALQVADTAAQVDASIMGLTALGSHLHITITDTAANVSLYITDLVGLGSALTITLTDSAPVMAATAASLAPVNSDLTPGTQLAITDTGANIAAHAAALASISGSIGTITLSDGTTVSVATAAALATLDGHLAPGVMLTVTGSVSSIIADLGALTILQVDGHLAHVTIAGATVADATANRVVLNGLPTQISIVDSANHVDSGLDTLAQVTGLQYILLDDPGTPTLSMSVSTLSADSVVLTKILSAYQIAISDTSQDISADLASITSVITANLAQISQITASDGQNLVLTQSQLLAVGVDDGAASALAKFTGGISATGVDVSHLPTIAALYHAPAAISVTDTSADISADLALGNASHLLSARPNLSNVIVADGEVVYLTAAQALAAGVDDGPQSVIGLLLGSSFSVTDARIADLSSLQGLYVEPFPIAISDTAAHISSDLASGSPLLVAALPTISTVVVSDGMTISLTEQQLRAPGVDDGAESLLTKVTGGLLAVTEVAASDLAEILALDVAPSSISIHDSAAHVVSNFLTEIADFASITAIDVTSGPLTLTAAEALSPHADDGSGSLIDLVSGHAFNVSGASVSQLASLLARPYTPLSVAVSDSSTNIVADLTSGNSQLGVALSLLSTINVLHNVLTVTDLQADTILASPTLNSVIGSLAPATVVAVIDVPVADLANVAASSWQQLSISVLDTTANLSADLTSMNSQLVANSGVIGSVTLADDGTVTAAVLSDLTALPNFSTGVHILTLADDAAAVLALPPATVEQAQVVHIIDTPGSVLTHLNALQTAFAGSAAITLTGMSPALSITLAQYVADQSTIDAITNLGSVTVTGDASTVAELVNTLAADPTVISVVVHDSAADVIANLSTLQFAGDKLHVSLSDSSITANLVSPLLGIAHLSPQGLPVVDSGTQIASVVESGDVASIAYLNAYGASLADSSPVTVADAIALESLGMFAKMGNHLVVWDTAQHLSSPSYAAGLANSLVDNVYLKAPGGTVTVTAAIAANLFGLPRFSPTNPDGTINQLVVADTAAHIETNLVALTAHSGAISSIVVNNSATISDQTLSDLQGLGATAASGITVTVSDSGSTIADNAAMQASGRSILPSAWLLSGNATVSIAEAATLGSLANFNPGHYTITLNIGSDTAISVNDANKFGMLADSLSLNGHHLLVPGSVAQLSTLSSAALSVVTPELVDTVSNIIALPSASILLQGTVEVTGNETLTAATVSALLGMVHTVSGQGILASNLTFDNTHNVDDTVADLRALTSSPGWTNNAGTHGAFHLIGVETIANLISPSNTTFLSSLYSTTLQSDVIVGASAAASLASLASSIHFLRGSSHITVQDSASNLLNSLNSGGISFADTVLLAGPDHVDASDAEQLLAISHFNLNTSLSIVDSSANLLDGSLAGDITAIGSIGAGYITVHLAGPETLDAQTAESLVTIPGFADTQNLTIADDPSYLLNSANLTAEQMSVEVTLASDETVSANTVLRLSQIPHFSPGSSHLILASNDFAGSTTLKAIADMGAAFNHNGHSLTMTADALDLTPTEYAALQSDGVVQNGHILAVTPTASTLLDQGDLLSVTGVGVTGGTVRLYDENGMVISSNVLVNANFNVSAADTGVGHNFAVTESLSGSSAEGAPLVVLDAGVLENDVTAAGGSFASAGTVRVDTGKFIELYVVGSVPYLTHAALIYDPNAHTLSLDVPGHSAVTLITLGGSTHLPSLDASSIVFKTHG